MRNASDVIELPIENLIHRWIKTVDKAIYQVRPRKDKRGVDLISDVLPFDWASYDDQGLSASKSMSRAS